MFYIALDEQRNYIHIVGNNKMPITLKMILYYEWAK